MVTQGEYLGESFPEADRAASLEEGAHLLGEPLSLSVQEDAHTGLPTSPSSSHLCVIKIYSTFQRVSLLGPSEQCIDSEHITNLSQIQ